MLLGVITFGFLFILLSVKNRKYSKVEELSDEANLLFRKYGHYYMRPFSGSDCSASCSLLSLAAITAVIISCFRGDWWSIAVAIPIYASAAYAAREFNPTKFLSPIEQIYHDEIISWIESSGRNIKG